MRQFDVQFKPTGKRNGPEFRFELNFNGIKAETQEAAIKDATEFLKSYRVSLVTEQVTTKFDPS